MSYSSFLDNMMRQGKSVYNAKLNFTTLGDPLTDTNAIINCRPYDESGELVYSLGNPLLVRFQNGETEVKTDTDLSLELSPSFGLRDNEGYEWMYVGLQQLNLGGLQLVVSLNLLNDGRYAAKAYTDLTITKSDIYGVEANLGPIVWFARLALMTRVRNAALTGGVWIADNASIAYNV